MTQTPAHRLCSSTVEAVVARTGLQEVVELDLVSPMSPAPVGVLRTWTGGKGVAKAVYCCLSVEAIGLDSHMVFAFTDAGSLVPHFTLDSVFGQGSFAFHLDLIPRVELASNLPYVDHVYEPLTPVFDELSAREGLTPAAIGPRQRALMSPWMCVNRATEEAFAGMDDVVAAYRDHWFALVEDGVPESLAAPVDRQDRDARNRGALFSREVDPVWNTIERLVGEQSEQIRLQLVTND